MHFGDEGAPPEEISAYCDILQRVLDSGGKPKLIQIHTVVRRPAEAYATPLTGGEMDGIVRCVRERLPGVPVEVYYGVDPDA